MRLVLNLMEAAVFKCRCSLVESFSYFVTGKAASSGGEGRDGQSL